ncbi:MAG TPA: AMP-binding protein [Acidimicrobiales bacterium]|nr:AMP-binding protein [Acidimicrobiales bacterium]
MGADRDAVPGEIVLTDMLRRRAREAPDEVAVQEVGGRELTWRDVLDESLRWADAYRRTGVVAGEHVATMMPNSVDAYFAWLGVAWLRAIEVPVNNMYRARMLEYLVRDSGARIVVVSARFLDRLVEVSDALDAVELAVVPDADGSLPELPFRALTGAEFLAAATSDPSIDGPAYWDVAAMIYTSGTTGPSKGVLVPWAEQFTFSVGLPDDYLRPGGAYYSVYPAFHVSGKNALYNAAMYDARLVLRETFSPNEFWDDIRAYRCTTAGLVGPMAALLLMMPPSDADRDHPLRSVALGPLPPTLDAFKERFGVRVCTGYGMTEIGAPLTSGWELPNHRTCGRLKTGWPHYEAKIVDEHDCDVPPGTVGELVVRSADPWVLTRGYHGMPEATATAWRNGWFHTGDGFTVDEDGWFYFVDRMKDAIRRRGENISSFEVEALVNEHPAVQESAAVGVPSELGEDEIKVAVVVKAGEALDPAGLIEFLEPRMPRFMVPRYVEIVDALPKTDATMRTRKVELRDRSVTASTWDREAAQA